LASSSTIGAEIGAEIIVAASGPSASVITGFCITHASTAAPNAVLKGSASAVAMTAPQKNAAANSHGVSRSRRSRYPRIAIGTTASAVEAASAA
jgi:hypothetical protein